MVGSDTFIQHLCHKLFLGNPDGKKLLQLMKDWHVSNPVFPIDVKVMERHGGAQGWAGYRAGQLDLLLRMEAMANDYELKLIAESKKDKV